jgi:hypothetical protein
MLATVGVVEKFTRIPESALASPTEHSGAYCTGGRREDKKHAHGGGRDPAVDHNPIAEVVPKRGLLHNPTPLATQQFAPPGRRSP